MSDDEPTLPSEDQVIRMTDRMDVVGIDASDYDKRTYQYSGTYRVEYLQRMLELVDTLGWDEVSLGSIEPPGDSDGARLLLVTPDTEHPWTSEQASVSVAGRVNTEFDKGGAADGGE